LLCSTYVYIEEIISGIKEKLTDYFIFVKQHLWSSNKMSDIAKDQDAKGLDNRYIEELD